MRSLLFSTTLSLSLAAMTRRAARDLLPLPHFPSVDIELLVDPANVGFSAFTTVFPWRTKSMLCIRWQGAVSSSHSGSVVLSQSCGRHCGRMRDRRPRDCGWPRSPFGASGCSRLHGCARAPRSTGRWRSGPRGLDELVCPSFACEIVQGLSAKLLPKAAQVARRGGGLWQRHVDPRVGKCRPRCRELLRALASTPTHVSLKHCF